MDLFYSGTDNANRAVAFIVHQSLVRELRFGPISDKLTALYHPLLKVFIVLCYAPASSECSLDEYGNFLEEVEYRCREAPKGGTSILLGDMNAKVGRELGNRNVIRKNTPGAPNERGRLSQKC
ncbi:hypothetical protein GCK32_012876 [Trichostrongylus colubriformis]|uniref:Endonuclease/exonuclease/phosphatase domain-containing protein n=1 Tax=Trichostrongylus colubriformis TaxID=6319 RepID=A0AAN8G093_TRICO